MNLQPSLAIFLLASIAGAVEAAPRTLAVDTGASKVTFAVHATVDSFVGTVEKWTLDLSVPEGAGVPSSARFSANFSDLKTGKTARDRHMLQWIESTLHPTVDFVLSKISPVGGNSHQAEGRLSMHGVTKDISIPITVETVGDTLTIRGEVTIDDRLFGLPIIRKFGVLTVAPEVKVAFVVTGTLR